jgi:methylated-DNA-[protein]-cysteine S-methyltransferase
MIEFTICETPVGSIHLAVEGSGLVQVDVQSERQAAPAPAEWVRNDLKLAPVAEELTAYFRGELTQFTIELAPGGTKFQRKTWEALSRVPYGETATYADLAREVGSPGASRAVGLAMRNNPLGIILPCHRVVGSNGKLTGFAHGIDMKRSLLEFERCNFKSPKSLAWKDVAASFATAKTKSLFPS